MNEKLADSVPIKVIGTPSQPINSYGSFLVRLIHTGNSRYCMLYYSSLLYGISLFVYASFIQHLMSSYTYRLMSYMYTLN